MSLLIELWGIFSPTQRRSVLAAQALSLAMALSTMAGIAAIAPFFAALGSPQLIEHHRLLGWLYAHGGFTSERSFLIALGAAFAAVVLAANLVNALGSLALDRLALEIGHELQARLFDEYLGRPYLFHARTHSATLHNSIIFEAARVSSGILQNAFTLFTGAATAALIVVSVVIIDPVLAVAILAALGGGYLAVFLAAHERLLQLGRAHSRAWSERARLVSETLGAFREILLMRDKRQLRERFAGASREVARAVARIHAAGQLPKHLMECVAVSALVGAALLVAGRNRAAGAWLGELTFIAFAAYRLLPILQQVFAAAVRVRAEQGGLDVIIADLRAARARAGAARAHISPLVRSWWRMRPQGEIELVGASFRYTTDGPWAIAGASLRIPAGATIGIVGANGSGKTTLLDLIAGLICPLGGEMRVDGVRIGDANRRLWQRHIAYLPQQILLLDASIAQNIALGAGSAGIDRERLHAAARAAQLEPFVSTLPLGYEHRIGERGVELSGGYRQRIGIARALYRRASLLLLDEPTSALDGLSEMELLGALARLRGEHTIVLVSHSLGAVRSCDLVYQLDGGRVSGGGTYDELARSSELLRRMGGT